MADDDSPQSGREGGVLPVLRLTVELLRAVGWPAVVLVAVLLYGNDLMNWLSQRDVTIPGVVTVEAAVQQIGTKAQQLEASATDSLESLRSDLRDLEDRINRGTAPDNGPPGPGKVSLDALQNRLDQTIRNIRSDADQIAAQAQGVIATDQLARRRSTIDPSALARVEAAERWERTGFDHLVERQVDDAIGAFAKAERAYPTYHNVAEIRRLLERRRDALASPDAADAWREVNRRIVGDYSWGMPAGIKARLRE